MLANWLVLDSIVLEGYKAAAISSQHPAPLSLPTSHPHLSLTSSPLSLPTRTYPHPSHLLTSSPLSLPTHTYPHPSHLLTSSLPHILTPLTPYPHISSPLSLAHILTPSHPHPSLLSQHFLPLDPQSLLGGYQCHWLNYQQGAKYLDNLFSYFNRVSLRKYQPSESIDYAIPGIYTPQPTPLPQNTPVEIRNVRTHYRTFTHTSAHSRIHTFLHIIMLIHTLTHSHTHIHVTSCTYRWRCVCGGVRWWRK